jgi:hypothetical protein
MNTRLKTTRRLTCTAIVCAYNEEKSLQGVLEALMTTEFVDEIMAVDDGSRDSSRAIIEARVGAGWRGGRVIRGIYFSPNRGKGHAMAEAAARARGDILLYVDADLLNWNAGYAAQLLEPLLTKEAAMTIGYPVREDDDPDRRFPFLHWIAGQRAVWREDLRPFLDVIRGSRFGVETLINLYYRARGKHVELVPMHGLIHPVKGEKEKPLKAAGLYWREGQEIGLATTHVVRARETLAVRTWQPNLLARLDVLEAVSLILKTTAIGAAHVLPQPCLAIISAHREQIR